MWVRFVVERALDATEVEHEVAGRIAQALYDGLTEVDGDGEPVNSELWINPLSLTDLGRVADRGSFTL